MHNKFLLRLTVELKEEEVKRKKELGYGYGNQKRSVSSTQCAVKRTLLYVV